MRRILIDRARARKSQKRGGDRRRVELETAILSLDGASDEVLALDEALTRLAVEDEAKAELVKLRFYAGMSLKQAAKFLGLSSSTADRYWAYARAWLYHEMSEGDTQLDP